MDRPLTPLPAGPSFAPDIEAFGSVFPCGPSGAPEEVGLALSGGGYRATLFHLGALWRLNELGWLPRIDRVSTVSGGSLMAGALARAWSRLRFDGAGVADNFEAEVVKPTLRFTSRPIDAFVIAAGLVPLVNPAHVMATVLDRSMTHGLRLDQLPDRPRFIFNAADLATGVSWRFAKAYLADSRLGVVCDPRTRLADAVAASAAYPPFVAPFVQRLEPGELLATAGADLHDDPRMRSLRERVLLLDGGAYDNLGIEAVEGRCRIVLASDAGGNLQADARSLRYRLWWPLVRRTLDMAVEAGRRQRRRALIDRADLTRRLHEATGTPPAGYVTEDVALWRTSLNLVGNRKLPEGWSVAEGWRERISALPTRMWPMALDDRDRTINWGYLTADVMLRTWVGELQAARPPERLPMRGLGFDLPPA